MPELSPRVGFAVQADGPLAMRLDHVVISSELLGEMRLDRREDLGDEPWTAGSVQYISADGGYVNASIQRPSRRLDDAVFTYSGECHIEVLTSGTEAVLREVDPRPAGFAQVILRRSDGTTAQVTAGGVIGRGVAHPLSTEQVRQLAEKLDGNLADQPPPWPA